MSRAFALLMVAIAASLLTILAVSEAKPINNGFPLVKAALPSCFELHPCSRMNCVRRIA